MLATCLDLENLEHAFDCQCVSSPAGIGVAIEQNGWIAVSLPELQYAQKTHSPYGVIKQWLMYCLELAARIHKTHIKLKCFVSTRQGSSPLPHK